MLGGAQERFACHWSHDGDRFSKLWDRPAPSRVQAQPPAAFGAPGRMPLRTLGQRMTSPYPSPGARSGRAMRTDENPPGVSRTWGLHRRDRRERTGHIGYVLMWLLGVTTPLLILFARLHGCA